MIITLTTEYNDNLVYLNSAKINAFLTEGGVTKLFLTGDNEPFIVKETPEEIVKKINTALDWGVSVNETR